MKFTNEKPLDGWVWCELYGAVLPVFVDGPDVVVWCPTGTQITSSIHGGMRFGDRIEIPTVDTFKVQRDSGFGILVALLRKYFPKSSVGGRVVPLQGEAE